MLGVLEVGTAGVLLRTDSPAVVREAAEVVARCNAAMQVRTVTQSLPCYGPCMVTCTQVAVHYTHCLR
jgi:hypothetical protein